MSDLRERCIEAGRDRMGRSSSWRWWAPRHLGWLFDLWEPMIREDALEFANCETAMAVARTDERAKIIQQWGGVHEYLIQTLRMIDTLTLQVEDAQGRIAQAILDEPCATHGTVNCESDYIECRVEAAQKRGSARIALENDTLTS